MIINKRLLIKCVGYWYSLVFLIILFASYTGVLDRFSYVGGWVQAPLYVKILIPIILITIIGFLLLMLADFFKSKDVKHPKFVGFSLIFFSSFAAFIYFWIVVNRRQPRTHEHTAANSA